MENCLALPGRNLISTCNRRVRSVPGGQGKSLSRQTGIRDHVITTLVHFNKTWILYNSLLSSLLKA